MLSDGFKKNIIGSGTVKQSQNLTGAQRKLLVSKTILQQIETVAPLI